MNSFLQGKKTLNISSLKPFATSVRSRDVESAAKAKPAMQPCGNGQPTVEVVKEGDKVVRLIVVCGCGERVEIECLYPAGS